MKKTIFEMLKNADGCFVSGENIADKLKVSRTAIWKHIQQLRKRGYDIESSERRGYKLKDVPDLITPDIVQSGLETKFIGQDSRMVYEDSTDSTNELAKRLAYHGAENGTVVIAEKQTGGKGRLERKFFSPPGTGIYFSLILRPNCNPKDAAKFTLLAAAAVAESMKKFNLRAEIKWPNDILYDGRKIVGILTEMSASIEQVNYIVVGVGINVNERRENFPADLQKVAASLAEMNGGKNLNRADFFRTVLEEFERLYIFAETENFDEVFKIWRAYNITLGKQIKIIAADSGETFTGIAVDINENGALVVDTEDGRRVVYAGDVSIRETRD